MRALAIPLALLAIAQMSAPAAASSGYLMVAICGQSGTTRALPVKVPGRNNEPGGAPGCKICHIAMRKRGAGGTCCGDDGTARGDEPDGA